jgi:uncharacterized phage protein gp47/JayE
MYENITAKEILERMLEQVPSNVDKRTGSLIYNALMPAAAEMKQMYIELDVILDETFAEQASRDNLIKRCAERGIAPLQATAAVFKGVFNIDIPIGSRFTAGQYVVVAEEKITTGEYRMEAEAPGSDINSALGQLIPVEYIDGLTSAELTELLIPGSDEEDTEVLRARYFDSFGVQSFGGNVADYKTRVNALPGVGGCKPKRTPAGGGTVSVVILDSTYGVPSSTLIDEVQSAIDPVVNAGEGLGIAPIGHVVTVTGVTTLVIDIGLTITFAPGWDWPTLEPYAIDEIDAYFLDLKQAWQDEANTIVRTSQIASRLLDLAGVVDVTAVTINGGTTNVVLDPDEIPERGSVSG